MKKILFCFSIAVAFSLFACTQTVQDYRIAINSDSAKSEYGNQLVIAPTDETVTIKGNTIILAPLKENVTYTLSGYFNGQIISKTKNTVIRLKDAYIENTASKPAIVANSKTEISAAKNSTSYITASGRGYNRSSAVKSKRGLLLAGGGTLYINGKHCHGVEAEDLKIKGSGTYYISGTKKGSALSCNTLVVDPEKTFTIYLLNSKNGIKADKTIDIASGTFYLYENDTALKTGTSKNSPDNVHGIQLRGGEFHTYGNHRLYKTEKDAYFNSGAKFIQD